MAAPQSILVIKPSSLGDVVHTLPAVALLKRHWPGTRLQWLINPEWAPLLEGNPHVDKVLIFPRGKFRGLKGLGRILPWAKEMRSNRSELVLDFQGLARSGLIGRISKDRGGKLVGLSDAREGSRFLYDQVADVRGKTHAVERYLALVASLGIEIPSPMTPLSPLEWPLPKGVPVENVQPGFILLHPFSRGAGKSLTIPQVQDFCRAMAPHPVIIAGRSDEPLGLGPGMEHVRNLLNSTSIAQLIWLIRAARLTLSVDSGPMHIAAAIGGPLVSVHTWSDPAKVGPYRADAWIWQSGELWQVGKAGDRRKLTALGQLPIDEIASARS